MDWNDLQIALALANNGNVVRAAKQLGVAHTTVLRRIAALERTTSAVLFSRSQHQWIATQAGKALLEIAGDLDRKLSALNQRVLEDTSQLSGEVTVTTVELLASFFATKLSKLRKVHPALRIRLRVGIQVLDLAQQEADIAVRVSPEHHAGVRGKKVATVNFAVYGAVRITKEKQVDWICFDEDLAQNLQTRWESEHVSPDRIALRTNSRVVFIEAVRAGVGVGVLPCAFGDADPGLARRSDHLPELRVPIWVLTHRTSQKVARVNAVRDFLIECLREGTP
jgi:DNA-binding transcriptional LysR family regulator